MSSFRSAGWFTFRTGGSETIWADDRATQKRAEIAPFSSSVTRINLVNETGHRPMSHCPSATEGPGCRHLAKSLGRLITSQGAQSTASNPFASAWCNAAQRPPIGPRPSAGLSGRGVSPPHTRPQTTSASVCAESASATWAMRGFPCHKASALSEPKRRPAPPARMAPRSFRLFPRTVRGQSDSGEFPMCRRRSHTAWRRAAGGPSDSR